MKDEKSRLSQKVVDEGLASGVAGDFDMEKIQQELADSE